MEIWEETLSLMRTERRRNKREEIFQLGLFRDSFADFPQGDCHYAGDGEIPDLKISTAEGILGIEHTRILNDHLRAQEALQDKIIDRAKKWHESHGGCMLSVSVNFSMHHFLERRTVDTIAQNLAQAVNTYAIETAVGSSNCQHWFVEGWQYNQYHAAKLPAEITSFHLKHVKKLGFVLWGTTRSTVVPHLTAQHIQEKINEKENRLPRYRQKTNCDKLWLVIVADGGSPSSIFDLPLDVASLVYHSEFDRIFFFDSFRGEVRELQLNERARHSSSMSADG
jgi:hypothetical protein